MAATRYTFLHRIATRWCAPGVRLSDEPLPVAFLHYHPHLICAQYTRLDSDLHVIIAKILIGICVGYSTLVLFAIYGSCRFQLWLPFVPRSWEQQQHVLSTKYISSEAISVPLVAWMDSLDRNNSPS